VAIITVSARLRVGADLKTYIPRSPLQARMKEVGVAEVDGYRR